ncbi:MAG: MMPL family transporter, partial [Myxococcales bacterium]|nr:MMPL family transporter [Myxococcales bacterium]
LSDDELAAIQQAALGDPVLSGSLVSPDGTTTAVNVNLRLPGERADEVSAVAEAARALADELRRDYPELTVQLTGMALMNHAFMEASMRDMAVMLPVVLLLILGLVAFWLRSLLATLAIALVTLASAAAAMATAGWLGYPITPPSAAAPIVVLTLAVADGVHIVRTTSQLMAQGHDRLEAIRESMRVNWGPVTYTSLTTMVGFACLNFAETQPVWHLANMTVVGVFVAWLLSVTALPAMLVRIRLRAREADERSPRFAALADFVTRHYRGVFVVSAVVVGLSAVGVTRLQPNDDFVRYFDEALEFRVATDFTQEHLSGIYRLELEVRSGEENGISDPAYVGKLEELVTWLRERPEVHHVYAFTDILKRVNQTVSGDDPAAYRLPETREAAAQYLMLYEMGLPPGMALSDRINVDKSSTRVTITIGDLQSQEVRAFAAATESWLAAHAPPSMAGKVTGPVVIFSELSERNVRTMMGGNLASLLLISLCLAFVLRSARLAGVSLLPNILPIVVGYGIWGLAVSRLNIVASVAGTVSLGIIVDDTIHFLMKYERMRREKGLSAEEAVRETLVQVGPAMAITTVVLASGFFVLALSAFQMTSHLGVLTGAIAVAAIVNDLFLLPALLLGLARKGEGRASTPVAHLNTELS